MSCVQFHGDPGLRHLAAVLDLEWAGSVLKTAFHARAVAQTNPVFAYKLMLQALDEYASNPEKYAKSSRMSDPLSEILSLLKPRSYISSGFDAGGDWAIAFSDLESRIKCYTVVCGSCWLAVDGVEQPVELQSSDCFVLPTGRSFRLASDLALEGDEARTVFRGARQGGVVVHNGGGDVFLAGARFDVLGSHMKHFLVSLPPILHIHRQSDQDALRWSIERMMLELREGAAGGALIAEHLSHMMLVQALRIALSSAPEGHRGWFYALSDPQIGLALHAMHRDPGRSWRLADLAGETGMSRSSFSERFRDKVGETPMDYLLRWRMIKAVERLEKRHVTLASVATEFGYQSESSFSNAFKRVMGCSPRRYVRHTAATSTEGAQSISQP